MGHAGSHGESNEFSCDAYAGNSPEERDCRGVDLDSAMEGDAAMLAAREDAVCRLPLASTKRQDADDRRVEAVIVPFVVQSGRQLFMLAQEANRWVLAELRFDDESCTFVEVRRARYQWPREAFGVLLSRVAIDDGVNEDVVNRAANDFARWLGAQFQVSSGV